MFRLDGNEFSKLVRREFTETAGPIRHTGKLEGLFECYTSNHRSNYFDILHLKSGFEKDVRVENFRDNTHVSLHFQLEGSSVAEISGLGSDLTMGKGMFNLFNCVDPVSNFSFPKQGAYEYVCVGLEPEFFSGLLEQCGREFAGFLKKSQRSEPFSLFPASLSISQLQWQAFHLLQAAPVADSIRAAYQKAKVEELTLLSLGLFKQKAAEKLSEKDKQALMDVREFLRDHFLEDLRLEKISREFLLNDFKLKTGFKKLFGTTVFGYIHALRMAYAKELLHSGMSVGHVAAEVGYQTNAAFIRAFRLYYGISPGKIGRSVI